MDPLAHTLTGIALAKSGVQQKVGAGAVLALILASNIVDVDIFGAFLFDAPTWTYRRMWTHSLFTAPLLGFLAAFVFSKLYKQATFTAWTLVFALGIAFHVFMDLINSYGVVLLFPFSYERFELAWVFIIDLFIWGALAVSLLAPAFFKQISMKHSARVGLLLLLTYLLLCGILRETASRQLRTFASTKQPGESFAYVFPEPFGPMNYRGVLRSGDTYEVFLIKPISGEVSFHKSFKTDESDPQVAKLVATKNGKTYQWFFKAPVWEALDSESATVSDLRFISILLDREAPFRYLVSEKVELGSRP